MGDVLAVVLAGGAGERLSILSAIRSKPAVPFGGKYRLIDFSLSNCENSGIDDVLVLTQYNPRSLNDHIGTGRPWGFDRPRGWGIKLLQPYVSAQTSGWYQGTADAVRYNLHEIDQAGADTVLILGGDHVYKMDYRPMIAAHHESGADLTIAVLTVPPEEASRMGICSLDEDGRVVDWEEKPAEPKSDLASMGDLRLLAGRPPRVADAGTERLRARGRPRDAGRRRGRLRASVRRVLARRRHRRGVLEGEPRPGRAGARAGPLRPDVAHPHALGGALARQAGPRRPRPPLTAQPRLHRERQRPQLRPVARRPRLRGSARARLGHPARHGDRSRGRGRHGHHRQVRARRGRSRGRGRRRPQHRQRRRAGAPVHRDHRRRRAVAHPARRPDRAELPRRAADRRGGLRSTFPGLDVPSGASAPSGEPRRLRGRGGGLGGRRGGGGARPGGDAAGGASGPGSAVPTGACGGRPGSPLPRCARARR